MIRAETWRARGLRDEIGASWGRGRPRPLLRAPRRSLRLREGRPRRSRFQRRYLPHMRNTPNFVSSIGALRQAESESESTVRVSEGRMMPSSQSRAVA
jgi:hypothetical protein